MTYYKEKGLLLTEKQKDHLRDLLNNQVGEYLANGGRITKIAPGVSGKDSTTDPRQVEYRFATKYQIWSKNLRNKQE